MEKNKSYAVYDTCDSLVKYGFKSKKEAQTYISLLGRPEWTIKEY